MPLNRHVVEVRRPDPGAWSPGRDSTSPSLPVRGLDARTLNELYFGALERSAPGRRMRAKRNGAGRPELSRPGRPGPGPEPRPAGAGTHPGDRVAILSENRPEWAIADYACLAARCTDVPIYPTLPAKQVEYNLCDSGAVAVFVSTREQLEKMLDMRERLPALRHVIAFDAASRGHRRAEPGGGRTPEAPSRAARHPSWRADALQGGPGRSGHADLHLGHHR